MTNFLKKGLYFEKKNSEKFMLLPPCRNPDYDVPEVSDLNFKNFIRKNPGFFTSIPLYLEIYHTIFFEILTSIGQTSELQIFSSIFPL